MASAGQANACPNDDFLEALDDVADWVPLRRSAERSSAQKRTGEWVQYAGELESRLEQLHEQLASTRRRWDVRNVVCRGTGTHRQGPANASPLLDEERLELLARVRAEQLMNVRLLRLLASCAELKFLTDPDGDAQTLLDVRQRREQRARDYAEAVAEHRALWQAERDALTRAREAPGAASLNLPRGIDFN